jgi:crossover junction endodeoxyribonuclease RusA
MLSIVPSPAEARAGEAVCTAESLTLTLPIPPSINAQYATVQGRRVLSATGRAYKDHVAQQVMLAFARAPQREQLRTSLHKNLLSLAIHFQFGAPMRRDLDGGLKITQDAVCEALGLNDNRIVELHLSKQPDPPIDTPRITVTLRVASPTGPRS